ncbi:hypothetical protein BYT27DRAFT_7055316, partial [Phlegmacium glaucopus]
DEEESEDDEGGGGQGQGETVEDGEASQVVDTLRTHSALAWADQFILETRRKGGRQTKNSVLKQWMAWASEAINSGLLPDIIVDASHMIKYLKYAATRELFNTPGKKKLMSSRLSASSLKTIMTMLGRVRHCQEEENPAIHLSRPAKTSQTKDFYKAVMVQSQHLRIESENFDVTKGTILDSELRPEQINEVTGAIFNMNQLPSIIKSHFSWTW